jgi:CRP/FNR family transcriptional regulator
VRDLLVHIDEALLCSLGERIIRFVHRNAAGNGRLVVTHQMLAQHLGVTREAITRELRALKRRKAISRGRGYIQLA